MGRHFGRPFRPEESSAFFSGTSIFVCFGTSNFIAYQFTAKNGYGYLAQDIANLKDSVLQSNHPLDNLRRSNNIVTTTPTKKIPPNIAVRAKDFIKSEWIKLTVTATIAIVIGTYFCVKLGLIH